MTHFGLVLARPCRVVIIGLQGLNVSPVAFMPDYGYPPKGSSVTFCIERKVGRMKGGPLAPDDEIPGVPTVAQLRGHLTLELARRADAETERKAIIMTIYRTEYGSDLIGPLMLASDG